MNEPLEHRQEIRKQRSTSLPSNQNVVKLKQILDYNHTEEKLSKLLGIDATKVREVNSAMHEDQLLRERALSATSQNKRHAKKALVMLGHDPSKEKVKKTLGIDDELVRQVEIENHELATNQFQRRRATSTPTMDKRHAIKALNTLGLDISAKKAMQILGLDEEVVKEAYLEELQRQEERISRQRENNAFLNKKGIQKALNVMGYDPSLDKVMDTLGVEAGSDAEIHVRTSIPVTKVNSSHVVGKKNKLKQTQSWFGRNYNMYVPPYVMVVSVATVFLVAVTSLARKM